MSLIAAYDREEGDAYERHVARLARRWLTMLNTPALRQGAVTHLLTEIRDPSPPGYGCGWDDLRTRVLAWAREEDWIEDDPTPDAPR